MADWVSMVVVIVMWSRELCRAGFCTTLWLCENGDWFGVVATALVTLTKLRV